MVSKPPPRNTSRHCSRGAAERQRLRLGLLAGTLVELELLGEIGEVLAKGWCLGDCEADVEPDEDKHCAGHKRDSPSVLQKRGAARSDGQVDDQERGTRQPEPQSGTQLGGIPRTAPVGAAACSRPPKVWPRPTPTQGQALQEPQHGQRDRCRRTIDPAGRSGRSKRSRYPSTAESRSGCARPAIADVAAYNGTDRAGDECDTEGHRGHRCGGVAQRREEHHREQKNAAAVP